MISTTLNIGNIDIEIKNLGMLPAQGILSNREIANH